MSSCRVVQEEKATPPATAAIIDTRIAAYLVQVDAGLRDLPSQARAETRQELLTHLEASAMAFQELGETPEQATQSALARFGTPDQYCRMLRRELQRCVRRTNRGAAIGYALALFGGMAFLDVSLATVGMSSMLVPQEWTTKLFPLWACFCVGWLMLGSPFIAGWRVGKETGPQTLRAAFVASFLTCMALLAGHGLLRLWLPPRWDDATTVGLLAHSMLWCAAYYLIRLPVGLLAAWLGRQPAHRWRRRLRSVR